jgi:signal transduction histidine kinase/ActR/RegA family two-component response regulator
LDNPSRISGILARFTMDRLSQRILKNLHWLLVLGVVFNTIGWFTGSREMVSLWSSNQSTMKPVTGFCILILAGQLYAASRNIQVSIRITLAFLLLAVSTLGTFLFLPESGTAGLGHVRYFQDAVKLRMSAGTFLAMSALSATILAAELSKSAILASIIGIGAFFIVQMSLTGYMLFPQLLLTSSIYNTMSLPTTLLLHVFGFSYAFTHPRVGSKLRNKLAIPGFNVQKTISLLSVILPVAVLLVLDRFPLDLFASKEGKLVFMVTLFITFTLFGLVIFSEKEDQLDRHINQSELTITEKVDNLNLLSHELRNQLSTLSQSVALVEESGHSFTNEPNYRNIKHSINEVNAILNEVLLFSREDTGIPVVTKVKFNLRHMLEETIRLYAPVKKDDVTITLNIDQDIPEHIIADDKKIRIIARNLISNAVKYTLHGEISIYVTWHEKPDKLAIVVRDTGIGLPSELLKNLGGDFIRGDNAQGLGFEGIGLGMKFSIKYVNILGGSITARNLPGGGAAFEVVLPVEACPYWAQGSMDTSTCPRCISEEARLYPEQKDLEIPNHLRDSRILIAEDNKVNALLLEKQLHARGISKTRISYTGADAMKQLESGNIDILLLDLYLGDMDGFAVHEWMQSLDPKPMTILVTGETDEQLEKKAAISGIDDLLIKPFRIQILMERMMSLTEQKKNPAV